MSLSIFSSIIDLNQPQSYAHWSIFTISVANLAIIITMVVIFGLAVILPFSRSRRKENQEDIDNGADQKVAEPYVDKETSKM
jgi:hypothetical protein